MRDHKNAGLKTSDLKVQDQRDGGGNARSENSRPNSLYTWS